MITTLSFATFAVDTNLTQNRLQLSFIILLTGVTFKMVSVQSLPKIPYLTHLVSIVALHLEMQGYIQSLLNGIRLFYIKMAI